MYICRNAIFVLSTYNWYGMIAAHSVITAHGIYGSGICSTCIILVLLVCIMLYYGYICSGIKPIFQHAANNHWEVLDSKFKAIWSSNSRDVRQSIVSRFRARQHDAQGLL